MAASSDLRRLNTKLERVAATMGGTGMKAALTEAGVIAKAILAAHAAEAAGPDLRFSGWPRGGRMSSGFDVTAKQLTIKPRPYGLWIVADRGRNATVSPKRKVRVVMSTPWGPRTYTKANPMRVGGTQGHRTLTLARRDITDRVPTVVFEAHQRLMREAFR